MGDLSAERVARNQATFREANEQIADRATEYELDDRVPFICECADPACREIIRVSLDEYAHVRSHARWFLNAIGHQVAAGSHGKVIEDNSHYVISEKTGAAGRVAEDLDARTRD